MHRALLECAALAALAALLGACSEREERAATSAARTLPAAEAPAGPHEIVVFATQSLRPAFLALAQRYEADHPGAKVTLRCDGGAELLKAANEGQRCDLVAIGDSSLMSRFAAGALLAPGSAAELARSRLAIAVAVGNPKGVRGLADLQSSELKVSLGAPSSSIGRHSRWVLSRGQLHVKPTALAPHADGVLACVASGEVDAGIVYMTSFGDAAVEKIEIPEDTNTPVLYSIAVTREAAEPRGAAALRALALGAVGQSLLRAEGFLPPADGP
ncbi:MAG: extracellular solute-binding protein [Planctomycetes bacterium]|nr:extracellular solute-binding protein [Planctomycetota bacterium]